MNIRLVLLSLCYKEARPGVWCKPIGKSFLTYEENRKEWTNWVTKLDNTIGRWDAVLLPDDISDATTFREWVTGNEAETRYNVGIWNPNFYFVSPGDLLSDMM